MNFPLWGNGKHPLAYLLDDLLIQSIYNNTSQVIPPLTRNVLAGRISHFIIIRHLSS